MKIVNEYYSKDRSKNAIVKLTNDQHYVIEFYEDEKYIHSILYTDRSVRYVEDAAENYVLGIFKNIKDF